LAAARHSRLEGDAVPLQGNRHALVHRICPLERASQERLQAVTAFPESQPVMKITRPSLCSLALGAVLLIAGPGKAAAATATIKLHSDNAHLLYHSTNDAIAGALNGGGVDNIGSITVLGQTHSPTGYYWDFDNVSYSVNLVPGMVNYLHVVAVDQGGPANIGGFLAQVSLSGAKFLDGTTSTVTGSPNWKASVTGFGAYGPFLDLGANGVGPWGFQPDIPAGARWIWAGNPNSTELVYFSIAIKPDAPANNPPVARSQDVTVVAGADCLGVASINDDSFDPDGGPLTITQSPAGPYPVGSTAVTLTVTDSQGVSSTSTSIVTVVPDATFSHPVPDVYPGAPFLTCIIGNFQEPSRIQQWKVRWAGSGSGTVSLVIAATTVNPVEESGSIKATITDETGVKTVTVSHPPANTDAFATINLNVLGGKVYDLAIERGPVINTPREAHHYKLGSPDKRLEIGFATPLLYLEHHEQAWLVNAAANENVNITVFSDPPAGNGAGPHATFLRYSVRRPDCTVVVPSTLIPVDGTIAFNAGTGGSFVLYFEEMDGHFALHRNTGCDGGFYALPCPPHLHLEAPADIVVNNTPGKCGANVSFAAFAEGACAQITYSIAPGSYFPVGTTVVEVTATDAFGLTESDAFTVTVRDTEAPTLVAPAVSQVVECGPGAFAALNAWLSSRGGALAMDNCDEVIWEQNFTGLSDGCGSTGSATVTFTARDPKGNSVTTTATFSIVDTTAPTLTGSVRDILPKETPVTFAFTGQDSCGTATVSLNVTAQAVNGAGKLVDKSGSAAWTVTGNQVTITNAGGVGTVFTIQATATDECGNQTTRTYVVNVLRNANEGVGNGVDGNTPGHDNNGQNDDPGYTPGNPGAKNK
jgi:hypothetical protein